MISKEIEVIYFAKFRDNPQTQTPPEVLLWILFANNTWSLLLLDAVFSICNICFEPLCCNTVIEINNIL